MEAWQGTQAEFVDDPATAIDDADRLIQSVMRDRGYPVEDFDDRAAIVSVDHPVVVERYRRAHADRGRERRRRHDTESLRRAMQDYRALFDELVEDAVDARLPHRRRRSGTGVGPSAGARPGGPGAGAWHSRRPLGRIRVAQEPTTEPAEPGGQGAERRRAASASRPSRS